MISVNPYIFSAFSNAESVTFNGVDKFITLPNNCFNAFTAGTMLFWIKLDTLNTFQTIFAASISANANTFLHIRVDSDNRILIYTRTGGVDRYFGKCTTTTLTTGVWYQIIWSMLPHEVTINGVDQTISFTTGNANSDFYFDDIAAVGTVLYTIGQLRRNTSNLFLSGWIDEPHFYNVAKNSAARAAMYNGGVVFDYSTVSGCVSGYRHGDNAGDVYPTTKDYVSTNDGTMQNMSAADFVTDAP